MLPVLGGYAAGAGGGYRLWLISPKAFFYSIGVEQASPPLERSYTLELGGV